MSARLIILAFLISCLLPDLCMSAVNESDYINDTVPVGKGELPVLVNKDTKKVEYYMDEDKKEWVAADKSAIDLQKQYNNRVKIRDERSFGESQEELNRFEEDSMKGWIYDRPK